MTLHRGIMQQVKGTCAGKGNRTIQCTNILEATTQQAPKEAKALELQKLFNIYGLLVDGAHLQSNLYINLSIFGQQILFLLWPHFF